MGIQIFILWLSMMSLDNNPKGKDFAEGFLPVWDRACKYTIAVIEKMPEDKWDYKSTSEIMSFREQIVHIADNLYRLNSRYIAEEKTPEWRKEPGNRENVMKMINGAFAYVRETVENRNDAELSEKVRFFSGDKFEKRHILYLMKDHMTHHRAQMIIYLRENNVVPPGYVGW